MATSATSSPARAGRRPGIATCTVQHYER
jgi:hypothetical protein